MEHPFQIGIRSFNLADSAVGSLTLIDKIQYRAVICQERGKWGLDLLTVPC
jgi:hypothetical protein